MAERLVDDIFTALDEQTVVVPGTEAAALIVPSLASSLAAVLDQRKALALRIEALLEAQSLSQVLTSMPGIGVRTAARILIDVGDGTVFPTAGHLAAYAGLAPVARASGSSIRGEHPARRGNRQLKRALYLAAFASLKQPESRAYYDKKRKEGKHHVAAVIALARRRIDVLFAMLRDGTFYMHEVFESTARAIDGLEKAVEAADLLEETLALDPRRPRTTSAAAGATAFQALDLADHQLDGGEAA